MDCCKATVVLRMRRWNDSFFRLRSMQVFDSITLKETFSFDDANDYVLDFYLLETSMIGEGDKYQNKLECFRCACSCPLFPLSTSLGIVQKQHYAHKQAEHLSIQKYVAS